MGRGVAASDGAGALVLARLLASRLSHDLGGPLAGLGAALGEVAQDAGALARAEDAALLLRRRLALLHTAWGSEPAPLGRRTLQELAVGLPNAPLLHLELDALAEEPAFARAAAPVVASAVLLAAESLPRGGMLAMAGAPRGVVLVTIAGPGAAWPSGLGAMLASAQAAWDAVAGLAEPRLLSAPMTALLAHRAGARAALLLAGRAEAAPPLLLDFSALGSA